MGKGRKNKTKKMKNRKSQIKKKMRERKKADATREARKSGKRR